MRFAPPLPLKDRYYAAIEKEIGRIFKELIYIPLFKTIGAEEVMNASEQDDPLYRAIYEGKVWFEDGRFFGTYNAAISRRLREIGAKYNPASKTWSYSGALPPIVSSAIAASAARYTAMRQAVLTTLTDMNIDSINRISNIPDRYIQTITWMNDDFKKAVKSVTIPPNLTIEQRNIIAAEWGQNLDLYVRGWAEEEILKLRRMVQQNAFEGRRSSSMVSYIKQSFGVSQRKATFLARQETALLMSKFHETRLKEIGSTQYKWSTSHDERVRHDHELLDGKIFSWDSPPVVDLKNGRRANPGEDFGCRCVAIPIIGQRHGQ